MRSLPSSLLSLSLFSVDGCSDVQAHPLRYGGQVGRDLRQGVRQHFEPGRTSGGYDRFLSVCRGLSFLYVPLSISFVDASRSDLFYESQASPLTSVLAQTRSSRNVSRSFSLLPASTPTKALSLLQSAPSSSSTQSSAAPSTSTLSPSKPSRRASRPEVPARPSTSPAPESLPHFSRRSKIALGRAHRERGWSCCRRKKR